MGCKRRGSVGRLVQIIRLVPGSEGGSRPMADARRGRQQWWHMPKSVIPATHRVQPSRVEPGHPHRISARAK